MKDGVAIRPVSIFLSVSGEYTCTQSHLNQGPLPPRITEHLSEQPPGTDVFWTQGDSHHLPSIVPL